MKSTYFWLFLRRVLLTVDGEVTLRRHGAEWVADPTLEGAVVGAVHRLQGHRLVVHGEGDSVTLMERLVVLHPHSGADGAGGLTAEVGGAFVFYQDGFFGAADDGSSNRC